QALIDQISEAPQFKGRIGPLGPFSATLDSMSLALSARLLGVSDPQQTVDILRNAVFKDRQIEYSREENDPANIFPHLVLKRGSGSCLGISLLVLMLGERLNLPVYGVLAPGHFFVRFDNGAYRCNIESTRMGACIDDSVYQARFALSTTSWYNLRNLEPREVTAVLQFAVGNCLRQAGAFSGALRCYGWASEGLRGYAEAWGNMGVVYDTLGQRDKAVAALLKAKALRPDLPDINRNLGTLFLKTRDFDEAIIEYQQGLLFNPKDADLHFGLGCAYYYNNEPDRAENELLEAYGKRPYLKTAAALLADIYKKNGDREKSDFYKKLSQ
ncbi:MAG: transglutaminase family protein, partial [Chitinivibrionales bacterium]|nr:transglutaminase family protein [Chitinivibrionales bacterium]